jgi:hypothetical protein
MTGQTRKTRTNEIILFRSNMTFFWTDMTLRHGNGTIKTCPKDAFTNTKHS